MNECTPHPGKRSKIIYKIMKIVLYNVVLLCHIIVIENVIKEVR